MASQTGSGGIPSGAAGGVLGGTYPNPSFATNGTTPILGTVIAALGADVPMTNANQFYDGPSVALTAGTWFLMGRVVMLAVAANPHCVARLWDGTTSYDEGDVSGYAATAAVSIPVSGIVVVISPATLKISAVQNAGGGTLRAAAVANSAGNLASTLRAVRLA